MTEQAFLEAMGVPEMAIERPPETTKKGPYIRNEEFLNGIGVDTSKLSKAQIARINEIDDPTKLSGEETTIFFKSLGVNMHKLVAVMNRRMEGGEPEDGVLDICTRVGRNDKCPCDSGKKYKKCCERKIPA